MGHQRRVVTIAALSSVGLTLLSVGTTAFAAPVTVNGATFDAPAACQPAGQALVCKVDGQQLELWVTRKPLAPSVLPTDTFVRKTTYFNEMHQSAVVSVLQSTANDSFSQFSKYGKYSALGAAMAGKGVVTSPTVRFASILHDEEIWEFLEVVATRTPGIEAMSAELQRSLELPALRPAVTTASVPTAPSVPAAPVSPIVATFSSKLLSLEHPGYLNPVVLEDTPDSLSVSFKHKTRATAGPNLVISLRAPRDKQPTPAAIVKLRKETATSVMIGQTASVDVNKLGNIGGAGFALVGLPDVKKGQSGVETLETTFAAIVNGRVLEVRLVAEQQYSSEARTVWALLAESIKPK